MGKRERGRGLGQISAFRGRNHPAAEGKLGGLLSLSKALDISLCHLVQSNVLLKSEYLKSLQACTYSS